MTSSTLNSILLISNLNLTIINYNNKSTKNYNSTLTNQLNPNSYLILANTFNKQINPAYITANDYSLTTHYQNNYPLPLNATINTNNTPTHGIITNTASNSSKTFYQTHFSTNKSIKINNKITITALNINKANFIIATTLTNNQIFALNSTKIFIKHVNNSNPFPKHHTKTLHAIKTMLILNTIIPENLNITELNINFLLDYNLNNNPNTIFYNSTPIKIIIKPTTP